MTILFAMMAQNHTSRVLHFAHVWQNNHALPEVSVVMEIVAPPAPVANPSPLMRIALREASNLEADWLWYAKRMLEDDERAYCQQRAAWLSQV
jgi:hypothetical protein